MVNEHIRWPHAFETATCMLCEIMDETNGHWLLPLLHCPGTSKDTPNDQSNRSKFHENMIAIGTRRHQVTLDTPQQRRCHGRNLGTKPDAT